MKNKPKYKTIIVRGCKMRVKCSTARELEQIERREMQEDWNRNRVD